MLEFADKLNDHLDMLSKTPSERDTLARFLIGQDNRRVFPRKKTYFTWELKRLHAASQEFNKEPHGILQTLFPWGTVPITIDTFKFEVGEPSDAPKIKFWAS